MWKSNLPKEMMFVALPCEPQWGRLTTSAGPCPPGKGGVAAMEEATMTGAEESPLSLHRQQQLPPIIVAVATAAATCQKVHYSHLGVDSGG
jgi:hypothetical protein